MWTTTSSFGKWRVIRQQDLFAFNLVFGFFEFEEKIDRYFSAAIVASELKMSVIRMCVDEMEFGLGRARVGPICEI